MGYPDITGEHEIEIGLRRTLLRERFLKGPITLSELLPVARMPGKALSLWLLIRYRTDLNSNQWAMLPRRLLVEWGISKNSKTDAARRLEQAGLIKVERQKGYMLKVRMIKQRKRRR